MISEAEYALHGLPRVGERSRRGLVAPAVWRAFWASRLIVFASGAAGAGLIGISRANQGAFDGTGISRSFGSVGNLLAAPVVRWDAVWYLQIAGGGYHAVKQAAFFPLYPLLIKAVSLLAGSTVVAGALISLLALLVGMTIVHRLTALEMGERAASASGWLIAFCPMALFFSAVYTESLFLALSAGSFYAARRGRWALAGSLGGLAALTRVTGVLLLVPILILFFYGPREDRAPAPARTGRAAWLWPRYRPTVSLGWCALVPLGAGLFSAFLAWRGFGPMAMLHVQQQFWNHQLTGPLVGVLDGVRAGWHELILELRGVAPPAYSSQAVLQLGALAVAAIGLVGVFRRLPFAYGAYVAVGLLMPLSSPTLGDPLREIDRYAAVLFPLFMWAGAWTSERGLTRRILIGSGLLLIAFTIQFATWHWVGSPPS